MEVVGGGQKGKAQDPFQVRLGRSGTRVPRAAGAEGSLATEVTPSWGSAPQRNPGRGEVCAAVLIQLSWGASTKARYVVGFSHY